MFTTELVSDYAAKDDTADAFVKSIQEKNEALVNTVVARTSVDLTTKRADGTRAIRNRETNLGDLCADAYRAVSGADIALVNGGGIRADIPAGDITYGQIIKVHPYGNALWRRRGDRSGNHRRARMDGPQHHVHLLRRGELRW